MAPRRKLRARGLDDLAALIEGGNTSERAGAGRIGPGSRDGRRGADRPGGGRRAHPGPARPGQAEAVARILDRLAEEISEAAALIRQSATPQQPPDIQAAADPDTKASSYEIAGQRVFSGQLSRRLMRLLPCMTDLCIAPLLARPTPTALSPQFLAPPPDAHSRRA